MVRILHLSDSHVVGHEAQGRVPSTFAAAVRVLTGRTTTEALAAVLDDVARRHAAVDLVVHTGDLTDDGDAGSSAAAANVLAMAGAAAVVVPGNHDSPAEVAGAFPTAPPPSGVCPVPIDGCVVILLDTSVPGQEHGALRPEALAALDEVLARYGDRHAVLALHHPPLSTCGDPDCSLVDAAELLDVIDRHDHVRAVLSGHLHHADELLRREVAYLLGPSTCMQLRHRHPLPDHNRVPSPSGYRVVELDDDGNVTSELGWVAPIG